jgi:phage-related protein
MGVPEVLHCLKCTYSCPIAVAKFEDALYVLHAFEKKTQKTSDKDLNIARTAYAELKKAHEKNC